MDNAKQVGTRLVELCNQLKFTEAVDTLYSPNIVSIEAMSMPGSPARTEGIKAIREKNEKWTQNHDIHSSTAVGPFPQGDRFIVVFTIDVTSKSGPMAGQRMKFEEAALYTVKDGKIVQEEFFYDM